MGSEVGLRTYLQPTASERLRKAAILFEHRRVVQIVQVGHFGDGHLAVVRNLVHDGVSLQPQQRQARQRPQQLHRRRVVDAILGHVQ
jgi:hypothetical protein